VAGTGCFANVVSWCFCNCTGPVRRLIASNGGVYGEGSKGSSVCRDIDVRGEEDRQTERTCVCVCVCVCVGGDALLCKSAHNEASSMMTASASSGSRTPRIDIPGASNSKRVDAELLQLRAYIIVNVLPPSRVGESGRGSGRVQEGVGVCDAAAPWAVGG
jgi:hypothetical protein